MNKYELAVHQTQSVLSEFPSTLHTEHFVARMIVERLIAQGVIQSTDPEDLVDARAEER